MKSCFFRCIAFAAWASACGGQSTPLTVKSQPNPLGDALSNMVKAQQAPQAKITFAVFGGADLADEKRLKAVVNAANQSVFNSLAPPPKRQQPTLVLASVDSKLPVHMAALIESAAESADQLKRATHVAFIHYSGPARTDDKALRAAAIAAQNIAKSDDLLVDMSTHRVFEQSGWKTWLDGADWMADQVVPGVEMGPDGRVTLFTRGMAKFGQPDLEWFGLNQETVREKFKVFQMILSELRTRSAIRIGDRVDGYLLVECKRRAEAIELSCVGID